MACELSIILPLRDREAQVAAMVRCGVRIAELLERPSDPASGAGELLPGPLVYEILALDERSGDNTLSVLSVLHGQVPALRTLQDIPPGSALARASRVARGRTWMVFDHPVEVELATWAFHQVREGSVPGAIVTGEVLVLARELGQPILGRRRGGFLTAQTAVRKYLRKRGQSAVERPGPPVPPRRQAQQLLRRSLSRLGFARLDRP